MDGSNYSDLNKTWIFDLDGTLVEHNGYKIGGDILLPGVKELFSKIPNDDIIIIITARSSKFKEETVRFLIQNKLRYNHIIFNLPTGERFLINDIKPNGLKTAYAFNIERNVGVKKLL
jgi:hypothetical protein